MPGELRLYQTGNIASPPVTKDVLYINQSTPERLVRKDSNGYIWYPQELVFNSLTSNNVLVNGTGTNQVIFPATANGSMLMPVNTSWMFELLLLITASNTNSHTYSIGFRGTNGGAASTVNYASFGATATSNALTAVSAIYCVSTATGIAALTAASTSATENVILRASGILNFPLAAAGPLIPEISVSGTMTGVTTILTNSYISLTCIGNSINPYIGNWS